MGRPGSGGGALALLRAHKWKLALGGLLLVLMLIVGDKFWSRSSGKSAEPERIGLIVLGGGVTATGTVPDHTKLRLDKAMELLKSYEASSPKSQVFIITLSGGTTHKPNPTDSSGFPISEAQAGAKYLLDAGVPSSQVLEESFSLDTLGNAYFLRVMHVEPGKFSRLVVITNHWHMPRTRAMFTKVFDLPGRAGGRRPLGRRWDIDFVEAAAGLDGATLEAREKREKASLATFVRDTSAAFGSMRELHDFLYSKHSAYASMRLSRPREKLDPKVLATY